MVTTKLKVQEFSDHESNKEHSHLEKMSAAYETAKGYFTFVGNLSIKKRARHSASVILSYKHSKEISREDLPISFVVLY